MSRPFWLLGASLALVSCGGGGGGSDTPPPAPPPTTVTNLAPVSSAGPDATLDINQTGYALDGSGSSDPEGGALSYRWQITSQPDGADGRLDSATSAAAALLATAPGEYVMELAVADPDGAQSRDSVTITLVNQAPAVSVADLDASAFVGKALSLDASESTDPNGHMLSYSFEVIAAPDDSGLRGTISEEAAPSLRFDAPGRFELRLSVTDGYDTTTVDLSPIEVEAFETFALPTALRDPVFHQGLGKIASLEGRDLLLTALADGSQERVALPLEGTSVSISPDGTRAAVGHAARVSFVNLKDNTVIRTATVPHDVERVVLDGDGNAHTVHDGRGFGETYSVNIAGGEAVEGRFFYETMGRLWLHPDGDRIYGANRNVSPNDVIRLDISDGAISEVKDSPYHGDFSFCGDSWMGPGGASLLTACGVVVRTTNDPGTDMTFAMDLDTGIVSASASAFNRSWTIIPSNEATQIARFDADQGGALGTASLETAAGLWTGLDVFASNEGEDLWVVAEKDGEHAMLRRYGESSRADQFAPKAAAPRFVSARTHQAVELDASESTDPNGLPLSYEWMLVREPVGSMLGIDTVANETLSFTPSVAGTYDFSLRVSNGERQSAVRTVSVNAFASSEDIVHRLEGSLSDAEYSASLNSLVSLSDTAAELRVTDLDTFAVMTVPLDRQGFRVGVAPNGLRAAVSHAGMVSLVDLRTGAVVDTQMHASDWGDIVLGDDHRAHFVPHRDQWVDFYSVDFNLDTVESRFGAREGTQLRLHPNQEWVYGADRGLSPSDIERWIIDGSEQGRASDSPYHGDYRMGGNLWIAEDGERILVAGGNVFTSDADGERDMRYDGRLSDSAQAVWADHSTETGEWVVIPGEADRLHFYADDFYTLERTVETASIPGVSRSQEQRAEMVFHSGDGETVLTLIKGGGALDNYAVQISD